MTGDQTVPFRDHVDRRKFISTFTQALGSVVFIASPLVGEAKNILQGNQFWTVGQVMDLFMKEVPGAPFETTVDTLKSGSRETKVTGIVTTMFATLEVIQKAISLQANFIIAHEPTFYNHLDDTSWLEKDDVYRFKADLLKRNNIAVWRNHDYIHRMAVDGVNKGVVVKLGWEKYFDPKYADVFEIPDLTLATLIAQVKERLGISTLRYNGDLTQSCSKI